MTAIETGYGQPVMSASGIAVAQSRTESARRRVTMKIADVNRRVASPNRSSRMFDHDTLCHDRLELIVDDKQSIKRARVILGNDVLANIHGMFITQPIKHSRPFLANLPIATAKKINGFPTS